MQIRRPRLILSLILLWLTVGVALFAPAHSAYTTGESWCIGCSDDGAYAKPETVTHSHFDHSGPWPVLLIALLACGAYFALTSRPGLPLVCICLLGAGILLFELIVLSDPLSHLFADLERHWAGTFVELSVAFLALCTAFAVPLRWLTQGEVHSYAQGMHARRKNNS